MIETAPAAPWLRLVEQLPRRKGEKCLSGWQQHLKTAAPMRRKMFGRTAIATRPTHTKWVGTTQGPAHTERAPTRGHEAENLGWRSPSLSRRVRGTAALPTPDDMPSKVLATGRGTRWRWKRVRARAGGDGRSRRPHILYPVTCGPKGHGPGSSSAAALSQLAAAI